MTDKQINDGWIILGCDLLYKLLFFMFYQFFFGIEISKHHPGFSHTQKHSIWLLVGRSLFWIPKNTWFDCWLMGHCFGFQLSNVVEANAMSKIFSKVMSSLKLSLSKFSYTLILNPKSLNFFFKCRNSKICLNQRLGLHFMFLVLHFVSPVCLKITVNKKIK